VHYFHQKYAILQLYNFFVKIAHIFPTANFVQNVTLKSRETNRRLARVGSLRLEVVVDFDGRIGLVEDKELSVHSGCHGIPESFVYRGVGVVPILL
jgi:hypothetical protein